jgi:response regulator RpfG family c-di-GMP phosphodiesterase
VSAAVKTVAVLAANPALSAILAAALAANPLLRVREFETGKALKTYMRIAPVDLLVSDYDNVDDRADALAQSLRHDTALERRDFQIIALSRSVEAVARSGPAGAGIDEVILKPMSPKYVVERVLSRLRKRPRLRMAPRLLPDNVVQLFPR